jgi:predicted permease
LHHWLIAFIGLIVPRRLRADWRQEWEAELRSREALLAEWDNLNWKTKLDLLRRSLGAFWDALLLQPRRLEDEMFQDLRYSARTLWKRPGFTALIVISLTLGILPAIVVSSLVNAIWLRPPRHVQAPERLAAVFVTGDPSIGRRYAGLLYPDVIALRRHVGAFADALAYSFDEINFTDESGTRTLRGSSVSENFFDLLGAPLLSGRGFSPAERDVAVLGYVAWQRRFNADPAIVGKTINLDGRLRTVIGVAPPGLLAFGQPLEPEVYLPLPDDPVERRNSRRLATIARLRTDATIEQARGQLQALLAGLREEYPQYWWQPWQGGAQSLAPEFAIFPESEARIPPDRRLEFSVALSLLSFLALLALAAACSNLAGLLLARGAERSSEIAVRLALGAQRRRVVALLLTESLLLVGLASALGLLIAYWVSRALAAGYLFPGLGEIAADFTIDLRVTGLVALLSLCAGVLFGLAPALQTARLDLVSALKGGPNLFGRARRTNLRNVFVAAQVAVSLVLLATAGLFLRGLREAATTDLGFDPDGVVAVELHLPREAYSEAEGGRLFAELEQRLRAAPEAQGAGLAMWSPFSGRVVSTGVKTPDGRSDGGFVNLAGPGYFELMKIALVAGRYFRDADANTRVAIVNEELARALWPNEAQVNALGRRIILNRTGEAVEIIGVTRNAKYSYLAEPQFSHVWLPFSADALFNLKTDEPSLTSHRAVLLARAGGDARTLLPAIRSLSFQTTNRALLRQPRLLADLVAERGTDDFAVGWRVAAAIGLFALALACVGVYGALSFTVSQRIREIGVRMALGARRSDIICTSLAQGLRGVAVGLVIGCALAVGVAVIMTFVFEGLSGPDPLSLGASVATLSAAALLSALIPAWRASNIDPIVALRHE